MAQQSPLLRLSPVSLKSPHGGTYFYHSHTSLQLARGLRAPLIIRDPQDAEDQDVEWTIVLDD